MTDLFIHIGAPKTGTTAIQHFLLKNREDLANQGLLYPSGGMLKTAHHVLGAAVFPARSYRLGSVSRDEALRRSVEDIRKEINDRKPHTVVISSEYMWGELSARDVQSLLQPFSDCNIKVIAYLRRQDLLAQSLYVQAVKGGLADPFPVWLDRVADGERAGFDFHKVLSCWTSSGVPADVVVRVYEKSQLSGDICLDFLATVCPQATPAEHKANQVSNPGPDRTTVELLRLVSSKVTDPELGGRVRKRILAHSPSRPLFSPLNYLSSAEVASFMARYAEQNAKVAREFLGRSDGKLFQDAMPADTAESPADPTPQAVLQRLTDLLPVLLSSKDGPNKADEQKAAPDKRPERPGNPKSIRNLLRIGSL